MHPVSFAFAGDVMIDRNDAPSILRHVSATLKGADIAYCNLEGPISDRGEKHAGKVGIGLHFRSPLNTLDALRSAGIDVVSLANNHAMDFGAPALQQTIELLDAANIAHAGAGRNRAEARKPALLTRNGLRIALLSYTSVCVPSFVATDEAPGVATVRIATTYSPNHLRLIQQPGSPVMINTAGEPEDVAALLDDVRAAKALADVVLVAWHWGVSERWGKLADYQRALGHEVIEAGANAIVGHHAHMIQGIEFHHGCPIFYSLGNFAFDIDHPYFRSESALVQCEFSRKGIEQMRLIPIVSNATHEPVPSRADSESGQKAMWMLEYFSEGMNTKFENRGEYIEVSAQS